MSSEGIVKIIAAIAIAIIAIIVIRWFLNQTGPVVELEYDRPVLVHVVGDPVI